MAVPDSVSERLGVDERVIAILRRIKQRLLADCGEQSSRVRFIDDAVVGQQIGTVARLLNGPNCFCNAPKRYHKPLVIPPLTLLLEQYREELGSIVQLCRVLAHLPQRAGQHPDG